MNSRRLHILWTSADPDTARHMVLMYAMNSVRHGWWDEVTVIVWGGSARVAAEHQDVREQILAAMHVGVRFSACAACARQLGVEDALTELGMEIIGWGIPLTELMQSGAPLLTV